MAFYKQQAPKPENIVLGEGVLVANFDPTFFGSTNEILLGAIRGGGTYNVEPTNKSIRFDGDPGEDVKGLKHRTEFKITITANLLELNHDNLMKIMPGTTEVVDSTNEDPGYTKYRPNSDFTDADYMDNLAYITRTKSGVIVAYIIENALGDGSFTAAMQDKEEIVSEATFTAHYNSNNLEQVPTYVAYFDQPPALA